MKLPTIDPAWRTETVLALCQSVRESRDLSALEILADALQDAGCADADLLGLFRAGYHLDALEAWVAVAAISFPAGTAAVLKALKWFDVIAGELGPPRGYDHFDADGFNTGPPSGDSGDFDGWDLLRGAWEWHTQGEILYMGTNEDYKQMFRDDQPRLQELWDNYRVLVGAAPVKPASFFGCSC